MSSVKANNWVALKIGEVADVIAGGTPKAGNPENFQAPGTGIAWLTPADLSGYKEKHIKFGARDLSNIGYSSSSAKLLPKGSLLFSSRAPIGYVAIADNEISTNQGFKSFVFPYGVNSDYAYYYLLSIRDLAESLGTGTTFKEISGATAKTLPFILPPLAEQKVIADKLYTLLAQVETTKARLERIPEILKAFRQSVLAAAVSGKLTVEWREKVNPASTKKLYETSIDAHKSLLGKKYKPPEEVDIRNLKKIPQNWIYGVASHLVNPGDEIVYGIVQPGKKLEKGVPYVRGTDIQNGKIIVEQLLKTSPEIAKKYERASLKENDILLGIIRATKVAVVPKLLEGANITQGTARFRANSSVIGHEYLALYLESPDVQAWLHSNYRGIDMPGLNLKDVRRLPVALPSIKEQTEIVRRVDKLFAFAASIEQNANTAYERVNNLTQSILAKAFRGELTAKWREQNPQLISGENSAEALLERIKVERKAQKPLKKSSARKKS